MTSTEAMIYQLKNLKGKPLKQKVEHIVTYFWLPIVVILVILVSTVSIIIHVATLKDTALSVICLNAYTDGTGAQAYMADFASEAGINLEEYEVHISTELILDDSDLSTSYSTMQIVAAKVAAQSVDLVAADLNAATTYLYQDMYGALDQVLTPQQQEKYGEYFLYVDMALVRKLRDASIESPVYPDPTKPEEMEEPVAMALLVPADSDFATQCYLYPQGGVVVGIVCNTEQPDNARAFLDYIME